ncbi:MlaE family ABC transporter permease [Legionella sp. W05-934-2]|uniref:MlaE family ABC transporter permease n=1 Tax=Legionella sp. W05-934-2 TaxID=1198649 RepID=UPI00346278FD
MTQASIEYDDEKGHFNCLGKWTILAINQETNYGKPLLDSNANTISLNGKLAEAMDSAGALALKDIITTCEAAGKKVSIKGFKKEHRALLALIDHHYDDLELPKAKKRPFDPFVWLGKEALRKFDQVDGFVQLIGDMCVRFSQGFINWRRLHWPSVFSNIMSTGIQALPIVALLSFLIGIVLAYQMGLQLKTYGANIFIAFLSGLAIFREFSPLITAIIVAGRTSSAFTAQIGSMKINEEIDAIRTMGLSPTELLVVPKVIALILVFPLLIFWSDFFSIIGAMLMSKTMLSVSYADFLNRLQSSVGIDQFLLGMYKAPVFALIISLVGCFQGFRVTASSDSIGAQTTKSVVQALFLIIIADAIYSIIYSWLDL